MRRAALSCALIGLFAGACAAPGASSNDEQPAPDAPASQERVARLEAEARALVKADGCSSSGQCRAAPVGSRPCGGPRAYVAYCSATTDSAALYRKLDELKVAEDAFNQAAGMASTCEFRTPPDVTAQGGSCRATTTP